MLTEVACTIASIVLLIWCFLVRPTEWHTAPGWYMNGVRPDGWFEMRPAPGGNPEDDGTFGRPDVTPVDERFLVGRIWCTGGATPRVSADSVWCQR